jgi:hypothetical protein
MVKTQVQIPDKLFAEAKRVAKEKEWSFAEVVRRGLEHITQTNPHRGRAKNWKLMRGLPLGKPLAPEEKWTELCH